MWVIFNVIIFVVDQEASTKQAVLSRTVSAAKRTDPSSSNQLRLKLPLSGADTDVCFLVP